MCCYAYFKSILFNNQLINQAQLLLCSNVLKIFVSQIGMGRETSEDTRLLFCTTGVLLQKLIAAKNMHQYTHVILDEVRFTHDVCSLLSLE